VTALGADETRSLLGVCAGSIWKAVTGLPAASRSGRRHHLAESVTRTTTKAPSGAGGAFGRAADAAMTMPSSGTGGDLG
jgi:hypothetical protein